MLIIPLTGTLSKDNLPLVTILIILVNVAVYFTLQHDDTRYYKEAHDYYIQSGLFDIELKYYTAYRQTQQKPESWKETGPHKNSRQIVVEMMRDEKFQNDLSENKIITAQDLQYEKWRELRDRYDASIKRVTSWRYGFIPKQHKPLTVVSHMFLHGSFMHLLGNMVFLWLVGCVLELGFGRLNYLVVYFLGGIAAVGLFYVFNMNSAVPLVGASGAISALMGAYTVAYGKTKINVFYSLGFYFNYTRMYAIVLLPLWLASELLQMFLTTGSRVAYLAHVGGLIGGALMGFVNIKMFPKEEHKVFAEDVKEKIPLMLEDALGKIELLDMAAARVVLMKILTIDPAHDEALKHLYTIDKLNPQTTQFHQTASKRLTVLCRKQGEEEALTTVFLDYCRHAGKPQLSPDLIFSISRAFARLDRVDEAEALIGFVYSIAPNHPRLPAMWLEMAKISHHKSRYDLRDRCIKIVLEYFPQSPEAATILSGKTEAAVTS